VLREEAALIRAHCPDHLDSNSADGAWISCHCDVADDMLRRLADEAQQQPDTQDVPDTVAIRAAELDDTSHLLQVGGNPEGAEFLRKRAALIRTVGKSQPAVPRRGDVIEQWLQAQRDNSTSWSARSELDYLLSQYRLHADTRTPLAEHRDAPAVVSAVPPQPEETACGPAPDECDVDGEPCANHEREQSHAEGDHSLCRRSECEVIRQS
jgi:hypothetical protein